MEAMDQTGPIKLTPNHSVLGKLDAQAFQINAPTGVNLSVNPLARSDNNQYDIFLHYHNDISHNRVYEDNIPSQLEQMVRLEILTDGATSASSSATTANAQGDNSDIAFGPGDANNFAGGAFGSQMNQQGGMSDLPGGGTGFGGFFGNFSNHRG
jgi:hypothetical protein